MGFLLGFFRENAAVQADDETEINRLVVAREQARKDRAWQQADAFRDQLRDQYQVEVEDTASGPIWRRI
jgi:cysteinyl-tRNA synthetase